MHMDRRKALKKSLEPRATSGEIEELAEAAKILGNTPEKIKSDIDKVNNLAKPPNEDTNVKLTIDLAFENDDGILEIFKGVYKHAKGGSVPHAQFIMKYWLEEGDGEEIKKFLFSEEVIENEN